jgi:murein DD-endopeptidase MepM/ murein hydrolase activator NlpD
MIPIVNRAFDAELNRSFDSRRDTGSPRIALAFRNTGSTQLPPGPVTIFDGDRYAGDALLPVLLPGGTAMLPYAIDVGHEVVREMETGDEELRSVSIVDGILVEERRTRRTVNYRIGKPGDAGRPEAITITHVIEPGWELISPASQRSDGREYTFVTSGSRLTVITERLRQQRVALTAAEERQLLAYSSNRLIDPTVRRALRNVLELRRTVSEYRDARQALEERIATIRDDQTRVSTNMQALERDSALYRRYVRELDEQENRLAVLREELADVREEEATAESALTEYLRTLQN